VEGASKDSFGQLPIEAPVVATERRSVGSFPVVIGECKRLFDGIAGMPLGWLM
jgi:hypothetical protein